MDKVTNEPARAGSSNPGRKTGFRIRHHNGSEFEDSPKRIPTSSCKHQGGLSKSPGTTLNPLRRFFQKNIGRPWNDVYKEICRSTDRRSYGGHRLLEEIDWEVFIDCSMEEDGTIYSHKSIRAPVHGFYVHPQTGLLDWVKPFRYKAKKPTITKIEFVSSIEVIFWEQSNDSHPQTKLGKTRLTSPCPLFSRRYDQTILRKEDNGWRIDYNEFYDPKEIIYRSETPRGIIIKRRKDSPSSPTTFAVKTKVPNKKELREINRLLSLKFRKQPPTA